MKESFFTGKTALLATKHGKEQAVAPIFGQRLDVSVIVSPGLDTDLLGTFTGEVKRTGDMKETVRKKAQMALENSPYHIAIATEGSFGPSPVFPAVPLHVECMIFVDKSLDLELILFEESVDTNFAHLKTSKKEQIDPFLSGIGFPEHAVIMKPALFQGKMSQDEYIIKGIQDRESVVLAFDKLRVQSLNGQVHLETDMRAHVNPSRMEVIKTLTGKMCDRLLTHCLSCNTPGFGLISTEKGLPCEQCGFKTEMVRYLIHGCQKCDYTEKKGRPDGIAFASPGGCAICNP